MGSIDKRVLKDGKTLRYDARIHRRRDGGTLSKSFKSKAAAQEWINEVETKIDGNITVSRKAETATFPDAAKQYLAEARPKNKVLKGSAPLFINSYVVDKALPISLAMSAA